MALEIKVSSLTKLNNQIRMAAETYNQLRSVYICSNMYQNTYFRIKIFHNNRKYMHIAFEACVLTFAEKSTKQFNISVKQTM